MSKDPLWHPATWPFPSAKRKTFKHELAPRARTLISTGNGSYNREYRIGEISLVIDGWWGAGKEDWNKEYDTGYFVEYGEVEVLEGEMEEEPTLRTKDESLVELVLEVVRRHMALEDMADA